MQNRSYMIKLGLKDRTIQTLQKKEAMQLVAYMVQDRDTISIFTRHRIEDTILEFIQKN